MDLTQALEALTQYARKKRATVVATHLQLEVVRLSGHRLIRMARSNAIRIRLQFQQDGDRRAEYRRGVAAGAPRDAVGQRPSWMRPPEDVEQDWWEKLEPGSANSHQKEDPRLGSVRKTPRRRRSG
jgi:hypothetical protein